MTAALVGSARVEIVGDLSALAEQGKAQITEAVNSIAATAESQSPTVSAAFGAIGEEAATSFSDTLTAGSAVSGEKFGAAVSEGVKASTPEITASTTAAATEAGEAAGARMAELGAQAGEKFSEAASETAKGLSGALLPMIGALGAGEIVKSSVEAADQLEGANIKVENVFGESGKAVNQWATTVSQSLRLSAVQADTTAGRFGAFLSGLGVTGQQGAQLSETLTSLTANMAVFNNADPASVESALDSALKGRTASLKQYGVTLDANAPLLALQARGVNLTTDAMKDGQPVLTTQQKALGTLYAVMDATKNQQNAVADTATNLKARQQVLTAEFTNFRAELGAKLMPILANIAGYMINDVVPALSAVGHWIQQNQAWLQPLVVTLGAAYLVFKLTTTAVGAYNAIVKAAQGVMQLLGITTATTAEETEGLDAAMDANPIGLVVAAIALLAIGLYEAYEHSATFRDIVNDVGDALKTVWNDVLMPVVDFFENNWKTALEIALAVFLPFIGLPLLVYQYWGDITSFFDKLWGDVEAIFGKVITFMRGPWGTAILAAVAIFMPFIALPALIALHWNSFIGFFTSLPGKVMSALEWFAEIPAKIYDYIVGQGGLIGIGTKILDALLSGMETGALDVWNWVKTLPATLLTMVITANTWLLDTGEKIVIGMLNGLIAEAVTVWGWARALPGEIVALLAGAAGWLYSIGVDIVSGLWNGLNAEYRIAKSWVTQIPGDIKGALSGAAGWLVQVGKDMIQGLINGMGDIGSIIGGKLKSGISSAISAGEKLLGINSPSKVMAARLGSPISEGVARGIDDSAGMVDESMSNMLPSGNAIVSAHVMAQLSGSPLSAAGLASGSGMSAASSGSSGTTGSSASLDDLVAAIQALAGRDVVVTVDGREIARASNNGNLALDRRN